MKENKLYEKDSRNHNWLTKNSITRKNMILEKFRKKNHQIWSSYERVIPLTNFNSELKREIQIIVEFFTSPTWHNVKKNLMLDTVTNQRVVWWCSAQSLLQAGRSFESYGAQVLILFSRKKMMIYTKYINALYHWGFVPSPVVRQQGCNPWRPVFEHTLVQFFF